MQEVVVEKGGRLPLPARYMQRQGLAPGSRVHVGETEEGLEVLISRPDVRKVYLEATARCHLQCAICVRTSWLDAPGDMAWETFERVLADLRAFPDLREVVFGGIGEPLMHPRFPEMLEEVAALGCRITLTTNGLLLDAAIAKALLDARVDTVVVSYDPAHRRAAEAGPRRIASNDVLANVRRLREMGWERGVNTPRIGLEFVAMRSNLEDLYRLPGVAREVGANFLMVTNLLPHREGLVNETLYDGGEPLPRPAGWPVRTGDWVLHGIAKMPRMKWGSDRRCRFVQNKALVVGWDGGVSPCYALMHSYPYYIYGRHKEVRRVVFGNVRKQSLPDIWTLPAYLAFRAKVRAMRFPSCVDCGEDCSFAQSNADCWGNDPSCADCLWAQGILQCP